MLLRLLILILILPLIDLYILIRIGHRLGFLPTIGLLIVAGMVGAAVARRAGMRAIGRVQADLAAGQMPADSLLDGLVVLLAGVLFLLPGVLSDVLGLLVLLPPVRALLRKTIKTRFSSRMIVIRPGTPEPSNDWVDVQPRSARDVDEPPPRQLP